MALSATLHNIESGSLAEIADTQNRSLLLLQEILQQQEQQQLFCRSMAIANTGPGYTSTPFFVTTLPSPQSEESALAILLTPTIGSQRILWIRSWPENWAIVATRAAVAVAIVQPSSPPQHG